MEIAIIGCGASGMAAAVSAVRNGADPHHITIYEASDRPGRKLLATGNGRCNLGNEFLDESCFYLSDEAGLIFLSSLLRSFTVSDLTAFFESLDIITESKKGYLYPRSMQAASVLNSLMTEINESGIRICFNTPVTGISKDKAGFILRSGDQNFSADKVIVSTGLGSGGFAIPGFEASGLFSCIEDLSFKKLLPALCGLKVSEDISSVAGVRARGGVSLYSGNEFLGSDEGEIQFTKDCISGIPVFQVSRQASVYLDQSRSVTASVDLCPEISEEDLKLLLTDRIRRHPGRKIYEIFNGVINEKLLKFVYLKAGISGRDKVLDIPEEKKNTFIETLKNLRFEIIGTEKSEKAQTMRGGIELINLNEDCELKRAPGLYVTGELLDIDGKCGGYNLWLAWATGIAAGRSVAK